MAQGIRIVSGALRGRRISTPPGTGTRPTADRVREALFSILQARVCGAQVLDLFSGSGALALEAVSRGADRAIAIDNDAAAVSAIRRNIAHCDVADRVTVLRWDIRSDLRCLARREERFSLVFMDPPYASGLADIALQHLRGLDRLAPDACLVVEHDAHHLPSAVEGFCTLADRRRYGKTLVSIFSTVL